MSFYLNKNYPDFPKKKQFSTTAKSFFYLPTYSALPTYQAYPKKYAPCWTKLAKLSKIVSYNFIVRRLFSFYKGTELIDNEIK